MTADHLIPLAARVLFLFVLATAAAWAVVSLTYPFGWDQGILAWVGEAFAHGEIPYLDRWDMKGPLVFFIFGLPSVVFGPNTWAIRLIDLFIIAAGAVVLYRIALRFTDRSVALWAALLFVLWHASASYWHTAQPDGWVGVFLIGAFAPLLIRGREATLSNLFISGTLIGCAVMIKHLYIVFLGVAFASCLALLYPDLRRWLQSCGAVLAGAVLPVAICLGWYGYYGALDELINVWLIYPATVYSPITDTAFGPRTRGIVQYFLNAGVISVVLPVIGLGLLSLWRSAPRRSVVLFLWAAAAVSCVVLQNRFFAYHWLIVHGPVTLLGAIGFYRLFATPRDENGVSHPHRLLYQSLALMLLLVAVLHVTYRPAYESLNLVLYSTGFSTRDDYYATYGLPADEINAADHIRSQSGPDEKVVIWGWNTSILLLSNRRTVSRFGYSMPLLKGEGSPIRDAYRTEFLRDINARPPEYIVVAPQAELILGAVYDLDSFPEFAEFVRSRYTLDRIFKSFSIYRVNDR